VVHVLIIWFTAQESMSKVILESHNWLSFNIYSPELDHSKNKEKLLCTLCKLIEFFITVIIIIIVIIIILLLWSQLFTPPVSTLLTARTTLYHATHLIYFAVGQSTHYKFCSISRVFWILEGLVPSMLNSRRVSRFFPLSCYPLLHIQKWVTCYKVRHFLITTRLPLSLGKTDTFDVMSVVRRPVPYINF
jgi:hypothetical protein